MQNREQITDYLNGEMRVLDFAAIDPSLNGLQVEGRAKITKLACAVDAGLSLVQAAIQNKADALLVHHGLFWGKDLALRGARKELFQALLAADLNLFAVHLPLDAHPSLGNNALLCNWLGLENIGQAGDFRGKKIGVVGTNPSGLSRDSIIEKLSTLPGSTKDFVSLNFGPSTPQKILIVSGSGADVLPECATFGFDTLITGEPRQSAYHFCKEHRLNAIFAGHYATETLGVQELSKAISKKFSIPWVFIDEPTGI